MLNREETRVSRYKRAWTIAIVAAITVVTEGRTQDFPTKPIRILTAEPGGSNDLAARLIAQGLSEILGQQVVVENRGGASGAIAAQAVSKAAPDGYLLLLYNNGLWTLPLMQKMPYDPLKDFAPVTLAVSTPNLLVVHPSLPVNSVRELIALAKAGPGELNYGTGGTGGAPHLAAELFKSMAHVNLVRVTYKGGGPALNAVISGQLQLMFPVAAAAMPHVQAGRLKSLAITSATPSALLPGVPTVAAAGLPGYEAVAISGIFAPPATPAPVIQRLNQEIVRVLKKPEIRERFRASGAEPVGSSPEQLALTMKSEMARMGTILRDSGMMESR